MDARDIHSIDMKSRTAVLAGGRTGYVIKMFMFGGHETDETRRALSVEIVDRHKDWCVINLSKFEGELIR